MVTPADQILLANYNQTPHLIICPTYNYTGNINRNGYNKTHAPRPVFKCTCDKTYALDNIRDFIDTYSNSSQQQVENSAELDQPQQEKQPSNEVIV